ncbi:hypothetical protein [Nocardioides sp. WS12]|nr:hypothetical protein [Nocardioides sp. WS12]
MFAKKVAVRLGALVLVAVTGVGVVGAQTDASEGSLRANWPYCC